MRPAAQYVVFIFLKTQRTSTPPRAAVEVQLHLRQLFLGWCQGTGKLDKDVRWAHFAREDKEFSCWFRLGIDSSMYLGTGAPFYAM